MKKRHGDGLEVVWRNSLFVKRLTFVPHSNESFQGKFEIQLFHIFQKLTGKHGNDPRNK